MVAYLVVDVVSASILGDFVDEHTVVNPVENALDLFEGHLFFRVGNSTPIHKLIGFLDCLFSELGLNLESFTVLVLESLDWADTLDISFDHDSQLGAQSFGFFHTVSGQHNGGLLRS